MMPGFTHSHGMTCLQCELPNLLLESRPPDTELVGLIEREFLEGQIDSQKADSAYAYLSLNEDEKYCTYVQ